MDDGLRPDRQASLQSEIIVASSGGANQNWRSNDSNLQMFNNQSRANGPPSSIL